MNHECAGSGRRLHGDPPPNEATTCPVCGRATRVGYGHSDGGSVLVIDRHQLVAEKPR